MIVRGSAAGPVLTLVLGGARSGKSAYAERLVEEAGGTCVYLATATAGDREMGERIARHQARRGRHWITVEEPLDLAQALAAAAGPGRAVLVDCLTLWLSNLLVAGRDIARERERLMQVLPGLDGALVLVSNEVGLGIVPENALARRFRDEAGWLHQAIAAHASSVVFMAAGLPMTLKSPADGGSA